MARDVNLHGRFTAHDVLACVGLTNLLFLSGWADLSSVYRSGEYFRASAPSANYFLALLLVVFGAVALLCGGLWMARGLRLSKLRRTGFLLLLAVAAPCGVLGTIFAGNRVVAVSAHVLDLLWLAAGVNAAVLLCAGVTDRPFRVARHLTIVLSPLLLVTIADSALALWASERAGYAHKFESPASPAASRPRQGNRVVVLVFDEFDASIAFEHRPADLAMRAFDRLRRQSLWAEKAYAPAQCTFLSLPMLLTGRRSFAGVGNEPLISLGSQKLPENWGRDWNVFQQARRAGARTAMLGWYHPYCSELGRSLDYCWSSPSRDISEPQRLQEYCRDAGVVRCGGQIVRRVADHLGRGISGAEALRPEYRALRKWDLAAYRESRKRLLDLAADPSYGFIVAHLPVPHPLGVYDRKTGRLTTHDSSNYIDNLELADVLLSEVRAAMENVGLWDATALIVTSDHGLRSGVWAYRPTWSQEESALAAASDPLRVPLLIKLAGPAGESRFRERVNVLLSHDLALALLSGAIRGYADLGRWIEIHREQTWIAEPPLCF